MTPSPPAPPPPDHPVILFDGVCSLCNGAVRFVVRRDPHARFRFAPLDSPAARGLLASAPNLVPGSLPDSIILVEPRPGGPRISTQSTAILRIARGLRQPWPLSYIFIILPKALRDWAYALIARNRYRWFGARDSCMMPAPELRGRFLEPPPPPPSPPNHG